MATAAAILAKASAVFEVDAEFTVLATLAALVEKGQLDKSILPKAIKDLDIDPEKTYPEFAL